MKVAVVVLALVVAVLSLAMVRADDDDWEDWITAAIIGNAFNCAKYGRSCMNGGRCCQYMGYSAMSCRNGQCLQTRCSSMGQRCNSAHDCCYHEGLTCYAATRTCGYTINNGRK